METSFTLTVTQDGYLVWAETLPPGERGETDDPGGHGISNLLRYAFVMSPAQPERAKLPRLGQKIVVNGDETGTHLSLTYTRRAEQNSLLFIPELSDDLLTWGPLAATEEISSDGESETVTIIDPEPITAHSQRFLRLRVER